MDNFIEIHMNATFRLSVKLENFIKKQIENK